MTHDAEPHMEYTVKDLERNLIIRYAAFTQDHDNHEEVIYHRFYAWTKTKERGVEFIPFV